MKTFSLFFQCLSLAVLTSLSIWHGYTFWESRVQAQQQKSTSLILTATDSKAGCCVHEPSNRAGGMRTAPMMAEQTRH